MDDGNITRGCTDAESAYAALIDFGVEAAKKFPRETGKTFRAGHEREATLRRHSLEELRELDAIVTEHFLEGRSAQEWLMHTPPVQPDLRIVR